MAKKKALGQGLDALFGDNGSDSGEGAVTLRMSDIEPNRGQPRQTFDDNSIAELADSIRQHGLIQPIVVRPMGAGYQIVAGERRWRACRMLGMSELAAIIKDFTDEETAQIALIENIQREDLNPVEEAAAYKSLMEEYGMTQEQLSKAVGKSRSAIGNALRLLNMPEILVEMLKRRQISAGQARALATVEDELIMTAIAKDAADGRVSVRDIEKAAARLSEGELPEQRTESTENPSVTQKPEPNKAGVNFITEMQISLEKHLGRKVRISSKDGEKGSITIDFYEQSELTELADKLTMY
ncbi:MAG: ParB/RepB/Spo0J family partition protein [Ruminococcus sp.]|nr:ParB/RepB/Spo0J family partition protein [Ruminococcus sp.]MCM1382306.1 ParB/RepB/Spo0J family partition protein [Muribaculaceae bacterium]MCM1478704.1 ParB/RepB/Spo0J family partition protein [Muribaculaceae bacterium]